jgi:hypothetical protein
MSIVIIASLLVFGVNYARHHEDITKEIFENIIKILLAIPAASIAILTWAYSSGNKRLGSVDLFASEISVICQTFLIKDFAKLSVSKAVHMLPATVSPLSEINFEGEKFTSEDHYAPVFDNYISDLKPLEFDIVNRVTLFYVYRKMMIESIRRLSVADDMYNRNKCIKDMIYMQFLMYESGRFACEKLMEFPNIRAECRMSILCSELEAFYFLKKYYPRDDFRGARLRQRTQDYKFAVNDVLNEVARGYDEDPAQWHKTTLLACELRRIFKGDEL